MAGLGVLVGVALFGAYPLIGGDAEDVRELGLDAYAPIHANRQLHLLNAQVLIKQKTAASGRIRVRLGLDAARATGSIIQLQETPDGLQEVTLDSPGTGIGPIAEGQFTLHRSGGWRLDADLGAGLLLFDRGFPAGGLRYDGMFSVGTSVNWDLGAAGRLSLGVRWLHLSNGHGMVASNPSYEGRGLALRWQTPL